MNSKNHEIKSCYLCIEKLTSEEDFINHKLSVYVSVHMDIYFLVSIHFYYLFRKYVYLLINIENP